MPLRSGWTALMFACNYNNLKAVKLLFEYGANPNIDISKYIFLHTGNCSDSIHAAFI